MYGLQLTYGGYWASGANLYEVPFESHGIVDESNLVKCETKELAGVEYVNGIRFGFTSTDLVTFAFQTSNNYNKIYGMTTTSTL